MPDYRSVCGLPAMLKKKFTILGEKTVRVSVYEPSVLIDCIGSLQNMEIILDETVEEELFIKGILD
jgi:hypothetical protein